MRIITLAAKYQTHIEQFEKANRTFRKRPYIEQREKFLKDSFGAPENRTYAFKKLGYQTDHIIANVKTMQYQWAQENDAEIDVNNWVLGIAAKQVVNFQPEILFITNYLTFPPAFIRELKRQAPSIRLVIATCGAPIRDPQHFSECDFVISNIPQLVAFFKQNGLTSYRVNHGFDPRVLDHIDTSRPARIDFGFIGSILKGDQAHAHREQLLLHLLQYAPLQIWGSTKKPPYQKLFGMMIRQNVYHLYQLLKNMGVRDQVLANMPFIKRASTWQSVPELSQYVDKRIRNRTYDPVFGTAMFQQLSETRVVLNTHIDLSEKSASNMRLYEATGVGACLLTDWKDNLPDMFEPEREVVTYKTFSECVEKVSYLLEHEQERNAIAMAGQERTLRDHTISKRVDQIHGLIQHALKTA